MAFTKIKWGWAHGPVLAVALGMKIIESSLIAAVLLVNIANPATSHATRQPSTAQRGRAIGKSFARPVHAGKPLRTNFLSSTATKAKVAVKPVEAPAPKRTAVPRTSRTKAAFKTVLNRASGIAQMLVGGLFGTLAGSSLDTAFETNEPILVVFALIAAVVGFQFTLGSIETIDEGSKALAQRRASAQ